MGDRREMRRREEEKMGRSEILRLKGSARLVGASV
jgi:hypothetical protein